MKVFRIARPTADGDKIVETKTSKTLETRSQEFDKSYDVRETSTIKFNVNIRTKSISIRRAWNMILKKHSLKNGSFTVRFTTEFAQGYSDTLFELAQLLDLESQARVNELREELNEEEKAVGTQLAIQNLARRLLTEKYKTASPETIESMLSEHKDYFVPDNAAFDLYVSFTGTSATQYGYGKVEKKVTAYDEKGNTFDMYRIITQAAGIKSCPVTAATQQKMEEILDEVFGLFEKHFASVKGNDMPGTLDALEKFVHEFRKHNNTDIYEYGLSESEQKKAKEMVNDIIENNQ